jgi:hypothetical protein
MSNNLLIGKITTSPQCDIRELKFLITTKHVACWLENQQLARSSWVPSGYQLEIISVLNSESSNSNGIIPSDPFSISEFMSISGLL